MGMQFEGVWNYQGDNFKRDLPINGFLGISMGSKTEIRFLNAELQKHQMKPTIMEILKFRWKLILILPSNYTRDKETHNPHSN
jgi:hypothetical protein